MKKKITLSLFLGLLCSQLNAQVGINTNSPSATLDILSKGNTSASKGLKISDSSSKELVTVQDNGNVGINKTSPNGKLHIVGDTGNGDVLYLENLKGENATTGFSNLLVDNSTGKVVKAVGLGTVMTNYRSTIQQVLDRNSTSAQLVELSSNDKLIETATSFDEATSTFTILEDGYYSVSGFVGFNGFRNDFTSVNQFVAMNLFFELSTDGGASWTQLTGTRNSFVGGAAGVGTTIAISPVASYLNASSKIRLIIQRPQISGNMTLGTPSGSNGHINLPTGQSYSKSVLIIKL
ncbi:hypothetical protein CEY12_14990 [Chryseobacterium sp. T16E-39]|uniref:hypothetical protein n=1 Tax=Chryseobacterium sp. T16E-39 TaxID=2015076 RepID=UPI000B5B3457|nr:hypothetical protein [Chryseobacterium sp. T16E-39]ASK31329.1 hypothetical protein CEY12_14990 [Chryseobacterium sp. T16E-39]